VFVPGSVSPVGKFLRATRPCPIATSPSTRKSGMMLSFNVARDQGGDS
jgi:hypothetical protein